MIIVVLVVARSAYSREIQKLRFFREIKFLSSDQFRPYISRNCRIFLFALNVEGGATCGMFAWCATKSQIEESARESFEFYKRFNRPTNGAPSLLDLVWALLALGVLRPLGWAVSA